ncbi:glycoside hydrolase family 3 C-terminal domain-containing protein [Arthrobacter sunyaminii]|uniref:Glycoside hydrolase family 3 C-terminal domain-containing protein n=1 Tax=Arthrobacter sunyaminii TaxID=2816859 RepID=A0A975S6S2_9MICC|nr:glycoside hydrolase family 3 C-terminal domain-containing protein [Arthrobacter sunyaminii]MBO0907809.1 glycoside hydrolase family 3 C-terminal domain-containing protein [Arthrobacter sunyaminii]QWQ36867.1 glycoside hydrolase family 3 C-terminal domain-containing protein [Arthrobacter sunyaminii]
MFRLKRRTARRYGLVAFLGLFAVTGFLPSAVGADDVAPLQADPSYTVQPPPFTDIAGDPFEADILFIAANGITTGFPDGTYRPLAPVARDAMAAFIYRLAGQPYFEAPATSPFTDITPQTAFYKEITWLASTRITTGYPDGTFRPLTPVARDMMAAFMHRYSGTYCSIEAARDFPAPTTPPFTDVPVDLQFATDIAWMKEAGISTGWPDGTYRPFLPVARNAMAAFMERLDRYNGSQGGCNPPVPAGNPWLGSDEDALTRAYWATAAMNLEQKVGYLVQSGGTGVPEFGLPPIRGKDGCCGLALETGPSTALPVGVGLASTFDPTLARAYGAVGGEEARAVGFNSIAGPTMDLVNTPFNGRMWEDLGEDPMLSGDTAASQVIGEQGPDIIALPKHYNLNNFESRRGDVNVLIDERPLLETYSRNWENVVVNGNAGSVMCAFNQVNSEYSCGNDLLLNQILKGRLGFQGFVSSDFNAAHAFSDYANGLDVAGPGTEFSGPALTAAVEAGEVSELRVTDAARRVAYAMFENGIIDNPPVNSFVNPQPTDVAIPDNMLAAHDAIAEEVAENAIVLLKNSGDALPLVNADTSSVAVIGSDADWYIDGGGSGAVQNPAQLTTILDGITARATGATVTQSPGTDPVSLADTVPGPFPMPSDVLTNVNAEYRLGVDNFIGETTLARSERQVNLRTGISADVINTSQVPGIGGQLATQPMSAVWTGTIVPPSTGTYTLTLTHLGTARLYVNGTEVINEPADTLLTDEVTVDLTAGTSVPVRVEYTTDAPNQFNGGLNDQPGAIARLGWTPPEGVVAPSITAAAQAAAAADVAVVVARDYTGEGADRGSLVLPQNQDALISAVVAANPNTVVVLATSGPVTMPWIGDVPAVLEAWYAGQAQGRAVASVLYGDVNPSGKLPVTFPVSDEQATTVGPSNPFDIFDVVSPTVEYTNGVFVGYKNYVTQGAVPLFPFGHGLSYTSFGYRNLSTPAVVDADDPSGNVSVQISNLGTRTGQETVQVYVGNLPGEEPTPARQLAGYGSITLPPGGVGTVNIELDPRSLQYWDDEADDFVTPTGPVAIYVGRSVSDTRLIGQVTVQ